MASRQLTVPLARASLAAVWLFTAVASLASTEGQVLLGEAGVPGSWHASLIHAGAAIDAVLGLALLRWHRRAVYVACGSALLGMTITATVLLPGLWLDPLGRLLKNLPIAALLLLLHEDASS